MKTRKSMILLTLLLVTSCVEEKHIATSSIINTWWCMERDALAVYLSKEENDRSIYHTYWDLDTYREWYFDGGTWIRSGPDTFEITYDDETYNMKLIKNKTCYNVKTGILSDTACLCADLGHYFETENLDTL
jgi:hypothetical protein